MSHVVSGQQVHADHGGVVPELAGRAHQRNIAPVVDAALHEAGVSLKHIEGIAFTQGPGLPASLHVGVAFARSLALTHELPLYPVHHIQAHVLSQFIEEEAPPFPFLCTVASGGHTLLVLMRSFTDMEVIGRTLDDAAGEAFDKCARMLGLPYPGGKQLDERAKEGDPEAFPFPQAKVEGYNMSFSGLKTAVRYKIQEFGAKGDDLPTDTHRDLCASVQRAICGHLIGKVKKAIRGKGPASIGLAGGVAANSELRDSIRQLGQNHELPVRIPPFEYCTDNAAMIGVSAHFLQQEQPGTEQELVPLPRAPFPSKRKEEEKLA